MEHANHWHQLAQEKDEIRAAEEKDLAAITRLLRSAPYSHIHADWHYPIDWLGRPSFVVSSPAANSSHGGSANPLFGRWQSLSACLAIAADPQPAAWVRLAAVSEKRRGHSLMAGMLAAIHASLLEAGTSQIGWLLLEDWPETWLPDLGFEPINEVVTYVKFGRDIPSAENIPELAIRPANSTDMAALAAIEARAFKPLWRHSELGLSLAKQQAFSFDVAWIEEHPVGFQFSSKTARGAHLSRITVDKAVQSSGVGTALLAHAVQGYYRQGLSTVTLNTQIDNVASQKLYERFGFVRNGERFPVWAIDLT